MAVGHGSSDPGGGGSKAGAAAAAAAAGAGAARVPPKLLTVRLRFARVLQSCVYSTNALSLAPGHRRCPSEIADGPHPSLPLPGPLPQPPCSQLVIPHIGGRLLLGKKLRGFGEGYYNGFGGKVELGETIEASARREVCALGPCVPACSSACPPARCPPAACPSVCPPAYELCMHQCIG